MRRGWGRGAKIFGCGLLMGAADLVPGVSGGTMAFITGIYEEWLAAIRSVSGKNWKLVGAGEFRAFFRKVPFGFLAALFAGILVAFGAFSQGIRALLHDEVYRPVLFSSFVGLVAGSVYFCGKQVGRWCAKSLGALCLGAVLAFAITSLPVRDSVAQGHLQVPLRPRVVVNVPDGAQVVNYDASSHLVTSVTPRNLQAMLARQLVDPKALVENVATRKVAPAEFYASHAFSPRDMGWLGLCGALAAGAMLLPGISGSYLLAVLGVYPIFIGALADFTQALAALHVDGEALMILASGGVGILSGMALFSRVVGYFLQRYRELAIALLTGFMIGALRAVWPFWTYTRMIDPLRPQKGILLQPASLAIPSTDDPLLWIGLAVAILSALLVVLLEWLAGGVKYPVKSKAVGRGGYSG